MIHYFYINLHHKEYQKHIKVKIRLEYYYFNNQLLYLKNKILLNYFQVQNSSN